MTRISKNFKKKSEKMIGKNKNTKKRAIKKKQQKGGLCLKSPNMDQGVPFHPVWGKEFSQKGGTKKKQKKSKMKQQKGGLCLKAPNMDQGAPFHPVWGSEFDKKVPDA